MKVFVGTSGWYYEWNKDKTLDWYMANSGLNAVELNASFYRFPFPNHVKSWSRKGKTLRWVIKVNQLITHRFKFSEKAVDTWKRFSALFAIMGRSIDFFLFQLPPSFTSSGRDKIMSFVKKTKTAKKFALEPRHASWFDNEILKWAESLGITWVSIDAPEFSREVFKTSGSVYIRMHGRTDWYQHDYKTRELKNIVKRACAVKPDKLYVFFNNDHNMLGNAQKMFAILHDVRA
jgi:uncharacterized protein YecE (DUF72 family)